MSNEAFDVLAEIAIDLRSAWNHRADTLWEAIDRDLWRDTANAWVVLHGASIDRLRELWAAPAFRATALRVRDQRRAELERAAWFRREHAAASNAVFAFFSMEFALSESLPLYSGGLGNVAGDYLKAASDLGVPLIGVGLLCQQGFRQVIDANGAQLEFFPFNDTRQLPIRAVRDARGEIVRVRLPRGALPIHLRAWEARVGRVTLYLLDSNDPANTPADRGITAQLYGGGSETRLLQEMALGIGGWRLLRALGVSPAVCHLNEGHAALVTLERARDFMATGVAFDVALTATRAGNVLTTHTPVEAGFDRFPPDLVRAYLGAYARDELRVPLDAVMALGRVNAADAREPLNMTWLAARASGAINGVSALHAAVSRRIFQVLFPRFPAADVPIDHVTNGIHVPSWDSTEADALWTEACGNERWSDTSDVGKIAACSDEELWSFRARQRAGVIAFVRERLAAQLAGAGLADDAAHVTESVFEPDALTIGMARRFTGYKRPTLLLHDPERFARLLARGDRPAQIVVAGKAHPRDENGKELVRAWVRFARRADVRARVVFLADYDLRMAERLVQGVDLWINTPLPPWEACGTSGMKTLVNGGLNASSLDGWWAEAYRPELGWAIPHGRDDDADAASLYALLEREIVPAFYERDAAGLPRRWIARVRASMAALTPRFSANRAVREYTERFYLPALTSFRARSAGGAVLASAITQSHRRLREHWLALRFGDVRVSTEGSRRRFSVAVYLDDLDPNDVRVELFADPVAGGAPEHIAMQRGAPLVGARGFLYVAQTPLARPASDYTPRVLPAVANACDGELPLVAWAR